MTLSKLSLRNAKRQARDYVVYFITIVMAVALIYAFNGLVFSEELKSLSALMKSLPMVVVLTSIVVVAIIAWLVSYTTRFMLEKRSRELGTYLLIGLENHQVARLFFMENLLVGLVALLLGLLTGNLLFQALRAITLSLFGVTYYFSFGFSVKAVGLSFFYFLVIYLFALVKGRCMIRKMKIYDLLYFDRQNEGEVIRRQKTRKNLFLFSIIAGIAGSLLILFRELTLGLIGAALIIFFLYGFFISFSSGVPEYFKHRPKKKYRGNTLLVYRTLASRLATMGVVMATIALLLTGTVIAEGSGIIFQILFQNRAEETTSFDLYIASSGRGEQTLRDYRAIIDAEIPVRESREYSLYLGDHDQVLQYVEKNEKFYRTFDRDILMKESDYIALRSMLGYPEANVQDGKYIIHCMKYLEKSMLNYNSPIEVGGKTLLSGEVYSEIFTQSLWDGNGRGYLLVVPDELLENQPVSHVAYGAVTESPVSRESYERLCRLRDDQYMNEGYDTIFSKADLEAENASSCAMIVFPLYYLALVLTMVSATILTIHQLSESQRWRRQYRLLRNLGMDAGEMRRSLRQQFLIFYAMPAIPPVLIGSPFLLMLANALDAGIIEGAGQIAAMLFLALGLFFAIYLIYILAAYHSMKRAVLPE